MIRIKRIYEPYAPEDGCRILVDRLWPRGVTKEEAHLDFWMKDLAPSPTLRKWFDHDPGKWTAFSKKYREELKTAPNINAHLDTLKKQEVLTLVYAAKDEKHTHALVLQHFLQQHLK
jgi:uncharacterized protein YeaO (DUF488 family)